MNKEEHKAIGAFKSIFDEQKAQIEELLIAQKKLQEEYEEKLYRLKTIIDSIPGSVYWKDKSGVFFGQNKFAENKLKLVGLPHEVIGKSDYEIFPKEVADKYRANDLKVMNDEIELSEEEEVTTANGEQLVQLSSKQPLRDKAGNVIGIIGNTIDITELKEKEKALMIAKEEADAANKLKTDFIHNMEHDIRTPLGGIWGIASLLAKDEKECEKQELLNDIANAANELLEYCNSILDFSSIEAGEAPVLEKKFNFHDMINKIINLEYPGATLKNIKIELDYPKTVPRFILADEFRLLRVMLNLVSNAVKFTKEGMINISVNIGKNIGKRGKVLFFSVKDQGSGIPKDKIDYIYEKFSRALPANKGLYKGSGLGLYIVKKFIADMDGDIEVTSKESYGTTFTCYIPIKLPYSGGV